MFFSSLFGNFNFDFYSVLGLTALFHLSSNLSKLVLFKQGLNRRLILFLGLPAVVFVILDGWGSKNLNTTLLEGFLGLFLVVFGLLFLIKKNLAFKESTKNAILVGSLLGFSAGLLGTGGAIRGLTMAAFNLEKSVFIATSAFIDVMIDLSRSLVYWKNVYLHQHDLIYVPFLFAVGFIGTWLGKKILTRIPHHIFKQVSLILILIIGLVTLFSWAF